MKFIIKKNQERDIKCIKNFWDSDFGPFVKSSFPEINNAAEIESKISTLYYGKNENLLDDKIRDLKGMELKLQRVAKAISVVVDEDWGEIEKVTIDVGFCPIAPRWISAHSLLLPCRENKEVLLNWSTHEMIHFLYFKKWAKTFPGSNENNFNYPDPIWIMSEILVHNIMADPRIYKITKTDSNLYDHWQGVRVEEMGLKEIFGEIYSKSKSFDDFLKTSWSEYQRLDTKYGLTKQLID